MSKQETSKLSNLHKFHALVLGLQLAHLDRQSKGALNQPVDPEVAELKREMWERMVRSIMGNAAKEDRGEISPLSKMMKFPIRGFKEFAAKRAEKKRHKEFKKRADRRAQQFVDNLNRNVMKEYKELEERANRVRAQQLADPAKPLTRMDEWALKEWDRQNESSPPS